MLTFSPDDYELVTTKRQLNDWKKRLASSPSYCLDSETTGLDEMSVDLVGVAMSVVEGSKIISAYIPVGHHARLGKQLGTQLVLDTFRDEWKKPKPKLFHNARYDMLVFGQGRYGIEFNNVHDSMYMAYVLYGDQLPSQGMDYLSERFLRFKTIKFADVVTNRPGRKDFRDVPLPEACEYAAEDTAVTLALGKLFQQALKDQGLWDVYQRDRQLLPVLTSMRREGVKVDLNKLSDVDAAITPRIEEIEKKAQKLYDDCVADLEAQAANALGEIVGDHSTLVLDDYGVDVLNHSATETAKEILANIAAMKGKKFNLGSPPMVKLALKARGLDLPIDRKTGKESTDKHALELLAGDELVDLIRDWRKLAKLKSSFVDALPNKVRPDTGRVHPDHKATRTVTGRFACADPNTQQIPTRTPEGQQIKEAFIEEPGHMLWCCDYSQIELRVAAHVTQDPVLLKAYHDDIDIHQLTASTINHVDLDKVLKEQRDVAKTANFLVVYGGKERRLAQSAKIDIDEAWDFLREHERSLARFYEWKEEAVAQARKDGCVYTIFGRRVPLPYINSRDRERSSHAERLAISGIIQGSAADLIRVGMVKVHSLLESKPKWNAKLLLQVHDELVGKVKSEYAEECSISVQHTMQTAADDLVEWRVPIKSSKGIGLNWRDAK